MKRLTVETLPSGSSRVRVTIGGKRYSFTASTPEESEALALKAIADYRLNIAPVENKRRDPQTIADMIDTYIAARSNVLSPSTIRGYNVIKRNRFQELQTLRYADLRPEDWQRYVNIESAFVSGKTLKNAFGLVRAAVEFCGHSVPPVRLPQIVNNERPYLSADEIKIFLDAVYGDPVELPALLALHSLRRSEICALTWKQIDLQKKTINVAGAWIADVNNQYVRVEQNKNQKSRRLVPIMIPRLYEILLEQKRFHDPNDRVYDHSPDTIRNRIKNVCVRAGLPENITTHSLRHSFVSLAYFLGLNEITTMRIGGYADYGTMRKIYTHISEKDINNAVDIMKQFYETDK